MKPSQATGQRRSTRVRYQVEPMDINKGKPADPDQPMEAAIVIEDSAPEAKQNVAPKPATVPQNTQDVDMQAVEEDVAAAIPNEKQ